MPVKDYPKTAFAALRSITQEPAAVYSWIKVPDKIGPMAKR